MNAVTTMIERDYQMVKDAERGIWHDYRGCKRLYERGRRDFCFCVAPRMFRQHENVNDVSRRVRRPH